MSNTILLLAMHPEIQDKVVVELKKVLPDQSSDITMDHLHQLTYLKQVIKESLRLLVITPMFSRNLTGEVTLSKFIVKRGHIKFRMNLLVFQAVVSHFPPAVKSPSLS
jgi:cytochrome P450